MRMALIFPSILLFALFANGETAAAQPSETDFNLANRAFHQSKTKDDYAKAAEMYRAILRSGEISAPLLNNLGNAYLKMDRPGAAIAAYERALRYDPGDAHIAANFDFAKNASLAAFPPARSSVLDVIFFWGRHLTVRAIAWLGAALTAVAVILAALRLFRVKLPFARTGIALSLFIAALLYFSALRIYMEYNQERGVVSVFQAQMYAADSTESQAMLKHPLAEGTGFDVLARRGDWTRANVWTPAGDVEGWMRNADVLTYNERNADFIGN
jgi:tetratricopeptide (TPR) repeat protein